MAAASRVGCRIGKGHNSIKGGWVGADAATAPGASAALPQASPGGWGRDRMAGWQCRMAAASRVGCRIGKGYNSIKGGWVGADAATAPGASAALPQASPGGWGRVRMAGWQCRMVAASRVGCRIEKGYNRS